MTAIWLSTRIIDSIAGLYLGDAVRCGSQLGLGSLT